MPSPAPAPTPEQVLLQWAQGLPPRLAAAWARLVETLQLFRAEGPSPYFTHPMALPVLPLARWVADASGTVGDARVAEAAASAMAGYLHVRVRDDQFDEGAVPDVATLLLSDRLLQLHLDLLVRCGGPPMLAVADARWRAASEAQLLEAELRDSDTPHSAAHFERLLDRSAPLGLPALAVLHAAGRPERGAQVEAALQPLVRAHQLLNDLVDLNRDAAAGSRSWLLARARAGAPSIAHWLLVGGGLDAVVAEIRADLSRARAAAAEADLPGAVPWLDARERLVDTIKAERMRQAMAALFTQ